MVFRMMIWMVVGVAVSVALWWYWRFLPTSKSPWLDWALIPKPKPLVTDLKQRDAVIAQSFKPALVENEKWDAVVIGSGIGGLSTAALLSRSGWKVLVLEQHDQAGGCCHSFVEKGFEFDVGIHYIGGMTGNTGFRAYMDQISDGQLEWTQTDVVYDHVYLGTPGEHRVHPIRSGSTQEMKEGLLRQFPKEEKAIDAFFAKLKEANKATQGMFLPKLLPHWLFSLLAKTGLLHFITPFFRLAEKTIQTQIEEFTKNKDLQAVFAYCFGDFGSAPSEAPWTMQALLWNHYRGGAGYPVGGASQIAHSIIPVIEKSGGKVLVRVSVSGVRVEGGRVVGVDVGGKFPTFIPCPKVISDAGLINTFQNLLPKHIAAKSRYTQYIEKIGSGHAALQLFVGLDGSNEELGLKPQNCWASTDSDIDGLWRRYLQIRSLDEVIDGKELSNEGIPILFISFASTKDPTYAERFPGKSVCTIVSFSHWDWFEQWEGTAHKKRGDEYERAKQELAHSIWERVIKYFPKLEGKDGYMEFGSPLSTQFYIRAPKGEIYGLDHSVRRFAPDAMNDLRPKTDIPGLWLTGQDIFVCGFSGAAYGGLLCAADLLGRRSLLFDTFELKSKRKAFWKDQ